MTPEEILIQAKDNVAKEHGFQLFSRETGGWTRFDKLWDETQLPDRRYLMDEVARECAELYHASLIAKAGKELPTPRDIAIDGDENYDIIAPRYQGCLDGATRMHSEASAALASRDAEIERLKAEWEEKDREIERLTSVIVNFQEMKS